MYESFKTVQNSSDRFAHGADADSDARNERIRRTKKRMDNKPLFLFCISEFLRIFVCRELFDSAILQSLLRIYFSSRYPSC
ncbi:hypothetical protein F2841_03990 [Bacteroides fragilis]|nr:hypothetical protein F3B36_00540 [Bacteroides fragilis]KAA4765402.1 hypothetical protein F3B47_02610 [Bacteroides fragilis]KAA4768395.1 hypothetical protein F3B25_00540 [Bacteroides fragilis]KAA4769708.1 hypothetical protein F3B24_00545 [Bacteroides fragilis]KAA4778668.1 hypothetical protein F2841_03990 [Bacteroides fragilis]